MEFALTRLGKPKRNPLLSTEDGEHSTPDSLVVQYLGNIQTVCPIGEAMCGSIEEIYVNARANLERVTNRYRLPKMKLIIGDDSFELMPAASEEDTSKRRLFKFNRITYCGVDRKREKTLAFNYHEQEKDGRPFCYRTHAILCSSQDDARRLAFVVAEYFCTSNAPK